MTFDFIYRQIIYARFEYLGGINATLYYATILLDVLECLHLKGPLYHNSSSNCYQQNPVIFGV